MSSKKLLIFFSLLMSLLTSEIVLAEKREKDLISLIDMEIKAIENVKKKGEQLDYRLFELYSEKTKILRRTEHENMLKDQSSGKKINKSVYYRPSELVFEHTTKFGHAFLSAYPKSRYQPNVYYGLASNQIEIQNSIERDQKILIEWLTLALKKASSEEKKYIYQVKLAEVYYTIKNYDLAIKNFEPVIKNKNDKWYTKNLYNLSWCYFQTKEYEKAVALASKAFFSSKNKNYENVGEQAMDALDYFYVFFKKPEKAIAFHIKNNHDAINRMEHFVKLLILSQKFISSEVALQTERPAREFCLKIKDFNCLFKMSAFKLDVYREDKSYDLHLATIRSILVEFNALKTAKLAYDQETLNVIINNIGETASTFQQLAYKSHYTFRNSQEETYKTIVEYYDALKIFNPPFHYEYAFLQAELSYKEQKYKDAGAYYYESLSKSDKKSTSPVFLEKLFKSMLALANDVNFADKEFFEKVHVSYLAYYEKDERVVPIYEALFKFYQTEKKYAKSEELLLSFSKSLPKHILIHKEMTKVVLNNYILTKDTAKLNNWIVSLKKGFLSFDHFFIEQNLKILAQLLFEKAQQKEKKREYAAAILEYQSIVDSKEYSTEIQADSLYNIAINYINLRDPERSLSALKKSLRLKTRKDMLKKIDDLQSIAKEYVILQSLTASSTVYKFLFKNYCPELSNPDAVLLTYAQIEIAQDKESIFVSSDGFNKCVFKDDSMKIVRTMYIDWLWGKKKFMDLASLSMKPEFVLHYDDIFQEFYSLIWRFEEDSKDVEFSMIKTQLEKFYSSTKEKLNKDSLARYTALEAWKEEGLKLQTYEESLKKLGALVGNINFLQPKLETELNTLMQIKDSKLSSVEKIKDANLYQAELYSLTMRFQMAKYRIGLWKCNSKNPEEIKQWQEVQKQIDKGLTEQMIGFKEAISKVIANGALPIMSLKKVRGDVEFDEFLYDSISSRQHFLRTRGLATANPSTVIGGKHE